MEMEILLTEYSFSSGNSSAERVQLFVSAADGTVGVLRTYPLKLLVEGHVAGSRDGRGVVYTGKIVCGKGYIYFFN